MSELAARTAVEPVGPGRVRLVVDGRTIGPVLTPRAAHVVVRWLDGGGLEELTAFAPPKLARMLSQVDEAIDAIGDLLKHGLRR